MCYYQNENGEFFTENLWRESEKRVKLFIVTWANFSSCIDWRKYGGIDKTGFKRKIINYKSQSSLTQAKTGEELVAMLLVFEKK